jgi:hypothetical protein
MELSCWEISLCAALVDCEVVGRNDGYVAWLLAVVKWIFWVTRDVLTCFVLSERRETTVKCSDLHKTEEIMCNMLSVVVVKCKI